MAKRRSLEVGLTFGLIPLPALYLVLESREYARLCAQMSIPEYAQGYWLGSSGADGCTHLLCSRDTGETAIIVALQLDFSLPGIAHAGLIVHESVHVFQYITEMLGEEFPSSEFQAYGIQHIAGALMQECAVRLNL